MNTYSNADKISWAIYQAGDGFNFIFKNKLNGRYINVNGNPVSGRGNNTQYTTDLNEAVAFGIVDGRNNSYVGEYGISFNGGQLTVYSVDDKYVSYSTGTAHQGGWVKIVEAPDFAALIAEVNATLGMIGTGLGQYTASEANVAAAAAAKEAMQNSGNVKLNTLNTYKTLTEGATLNMPVEGQYFRIAYDYGNAGVLYLQSTPSSVKGLQFTADKGNASVWYYHNGSLYAYTVGTSKNLREHGDDRGLYTTKTTAEFIASTRAKGKYNIKLGSWLHANSSSGNYYSDHCSGNDCAQHDLILEAVDMRPSTIVSTIGEYEVGTFFANEAVIIPEGVTAFVATSEPVMDETDAQGNAIGTITMNAINDGIIPAQTGVLICGEPADYEFVTSTEAGTAVEGNLLKGYAGSFEYDNVTLADGYTTYVLTVKNGEGEAGFYKKTSGFKVYYNKAYLQVPTTQLANLRIRFGKQEGTTSIDNSQLTIDNAQLVIYDLTGRRVEKMGKGIYIVNGKKVIVK